MRATKSLSRPPSKLPRQWNQAAQMLQELWHESNPPPVDRWLSRKLKAMPRLTKAEHGWYWNVVTAAHRLAIYALFAESVATEKASSPANSNGLGPFLEAFAKELPDPRAFWKALKSETAPFVILPWVSLRMANGKSEIATPAQIRVNDRLAKYLSDTRLGLMTWNGVPPWVESELAMREKLSGWSPSDVRTFLNAQSTQAPLWIRLNSDTRAPEVWTEFEKHGFDVVPAAHDATAWKVSGAKSIFEFETFKSGLFEIQDFASQQIGNAVESKAGQMVWDACAGVGGKTLQLAANQGPKGAIWASDIREHALKDLKLRARRAGFSNIRVFVWNGEAAPTLSKEVELRGGFHWVLVDAPCSASGTWRRNPDERFRYEVSTLLQLKLLQNAAIHVRVGGFLVYATCSWFPSENETVAEEFVKANPNFLLHRQRIYGCPAEDSDTTFTAVFVRTTARG